MKIKRQLLAVGKKIGITIFSLSILFTSGCFNMFSNRGPAKYRYSSEYDIQQAVMKAVVLALEEKDTQALKSFFSEDALSKIENIDEKLAEFSDYIDEEVESFDYTGGGSRESADYGHVVHRMSCDFTLVTSEDEYLVTFDYYIRDDGNRSIEGLSAIGIFTEDLLKAATEKGVYIVRMSIPGIYVVDDVDTDCTDKIETEKNN